MIFKKIPKEELEELIKSGKARKIHFISPMSVLKPRGSMDKESIGLLILERLISNYEHWSNPSYSDNPTIGEFLYYLKNNLDTEVDAAWNEALKMINSGKSMEEAWNEFWKRRSR